MTCGGVPLTLGARAVAWLPRSLFRCVGWRVQDPGWWAFRLLSLGLWVPLPGSVGLVGSGQHLFMVGSGGHDMTSPTLGRKLSFRDSSSTSRESYELGLSCQRGCGQCPHLYLLYRECPGRGGASGRFRRKPNMKLAPLAQTRGERIQALTCAGFFHRRVPGLTKRKWAAT